MLMTICAYGHMCIWWNGQSQVQTQRWGVRPEKTQIAQSAYLNWWATGWLMGRCVKMLPSHRTWARVGKSSQTVCLWRVVNVLDTNDHKDAAWGVRGRVHGVFQGDFLSNADCEGHQIQFSTALTGSAVPRQLGGHMSTVALCLSGHAHKMLAYITSGKREWGSGFSTFHKRTR